MAKEQLIIATRESPLALEQANWVKKQLQTIYPNLNIKLLGMTTQADRMLFIPLASVGGKGLFVKELEEALLKGKADIAVHSIKDMPMDLPEGLCLSTVCEREDPRDVFISNQYVSYDELPSNASVGTSSLRRQCQLLSLRPDLCITSLRGNVGTRLSKLDKGEVDAIILAAAGLKRLGLQDRLRSFFKIEQMLPAVGQGALGIECREQDEKVRILIQAINHLPTYYCIQAERVLCKHLQGGCRLPVAAYAEIIQNKILLRALVGSLDGKKILYAEEKADVNHAIELGIQVADILLKKGAGDILKNI